MSYNREGVVIITPGRPVKQNRYRGTCPYCNCTAEFPYEAVGISAVFPSIITALCPNCERAYNDGRVKRILTPSEEDVAPNKPQKLSWWRSLLG